MNVSPINHSLSHFINCINHIFCLKPLALVQPNKSKVVLLVMYHFCNQLTIIFIIFVYIFFLLSVYCFINYNIQLIRVTKVDTYLKSTILMVQT